MFTGIVEEIGLVKSVNRRAGRIQLRISAGKILDDLQVDHSVCINGVCLTAIHIGPSFFEADAVEETLSQTTLNELKVGENVNLERALRLSDRLGGHLVQGHVDGVGRIVQLSKSAENILLTIEAPQELLKYVIPKGSIAIDGISLTVARLDGKNITLAIIPHTLRSTILSSKKAGQNVNIEVDLIGKYVEKLLGTDAGPAKLTENRLHDLGY